MKYLEIDIGLFLIAHYKNTKLMLFLAILVYEELEDVAMASSLRDLVYIDDYKLLCGYLAMFLGEFERAQSWFLNSSKPAAALEMRCDLLQWDQGLQLAKRMAPELIGYISKEYAQQLEFM